MIHLQIILTNLSTLEKTKNEVEFNLKCEGINQKINKYLEKLMKMMQELVL